MTDLRESRFHDLLPPNLRDVGTLALSRALDRQNAALVDHIAKTAIYYEIDNLAEDVCDMLAGQFCIDAYDTSLDIETKRDLIRIAMFTGPRRGTAAAVSDVIKTIYGGAEISEWFDYDGRPFYFRIRADVSKIGTGKDGLSKLVERVNQYKNVRSWLEGVDLSVHSDTFIHISSHPSTLSRISVLPLFVEPEPSEARVIVGAAAHYAHKIKVQPKGDF